MKWPFDPGVARNGVVQIRAEGFPAAVPGVVYSGGQLESGLPLGALGTGYFTLEGTGRIGASSIYNDLVPPRVINEEWLAVRIGRHVMPLSTAEIAYSGHYPVADMIGPFRP